MAKPKVAFYWCASCGGCEEAIVDLNEKLLAVADAIDIVLWPVALDFKRKDVEAMPDLSIAASFINGAIRSTEQEEMAHMLRRKSKYVIAFGACSQLGGIPGLANLSDIDGILQTVYKDSEFSTVNPEGTLPMTEYTSNGHTVTLPGLYNTVRTLDQVIDVDYSVPGCPPTVNLIEGAVNALLTGNLPPKGTVLAPDHALCEDCERKDTRPERLGITQWKRPHEVLIETDKCLLAQGLMCLGPATRAGCGAMCTAGNMPCTGCFGPTSRVRDYGAKALSGLASIVDSNEDDVIAKILDKIPDPVGLVYRYSLAASALRRKKMEAN